MMGDLAETEFKVSSVLGKGRNIVYKCLSDLPVLATPPPEPSPSLDATSPLPASTSSPHHEPSPSSKRKPDATSPLPVSTSSHHGSSPSLKRKPDRWGKTGRWKKISKRTPKATASTSVISFGDEEASADAGEASGTTSVCVAAEEVCVAAEESGAMRGREFAIKIQYIPAKDYKNVKELSWVWNEFKVLSELDGITPQPLLCGWVMVKPPGDDLWTVGLFSGLVMPVYEVLESKLKTASVDG